CRGEDSVTQSPGDVIATEGEQVTLDCQFDTLDTNPFLFWYKQGANDFPKYMLRRTTFESDNAIDFQGRFNGHLNLTKFLSASKSVPLTIQRLQLSDSAVYYCALRPTVTTGYTAPLQKLEWYLEIEEYTPTEGSSVSLSCTYETSSSIIYLYSYQKYTNQAPQYLLYKGARANSVDHISNHRYESTSSQTLEEDVIHGGSVKLSCNYTVSGGGTSAETIVTADPPYLRLSVNVDKVAERVDLKISSAEVTDSDLYYCALRPTLHSVTSTMMLLTSILLFSELVGDTLEDDITPTSPDENYLEGSRVKLSCNYTVIADSLLWYRQYSGSGLQFLYLVTTTNKSYEVRGDQQDLQLSVTLNKERTCVDLEISSTEVTDSDLYYCALRPTTIEPNQHEVYGEEGSNVLLSCNYSSAYSLLWYKQPPGSAPQYLLLILHSTGTGYRAESLDSHLSGKLNKDKTFVDLEISSAEVTDSALYYCALEPTVTGILPTLYQDEVQPATKIMHGDEGGFVTLSCNYSGSPYNLQWYRQYPRSAPKFLLLTTVSSSPSVVNATPPYPRLSSKLNMEITRMDLKISSSDKWLQKGTEFLSVTTPLLVTIFYVSGYEYVDYTPGFTLNHDKKAKRMDLEISSAEVTDSALYYCALRPTVTGNPDTLYKNLEHLIEGRKLSTGTLINLSKTLRPRFNQNKHLLCQ
ncbi:unnamed protein product, partial [Coregonus sp. 'balchen']